MEITLKQIRDGQQALMKIITYPMDFKLAYRMRKIANQLSTEFRHIESTRFDLVKKHGEEEKDKNDKGTGRYQVKPENLDKFDKEFSEFLKLKTEVPIQKIPFECLEGLHISPLELSLIEVFLEELPPQIT